jgi:predicted dehydrogenase
VESQERKLAVGVFGTSWWADAMYLPALTNHPQADVVAICGRDLTNAQAMAARWSIPQVYTDYRALIAQANVDAVIVATSNASHYEISMAALDAGLPSLCEKPLSLSYMEAAKMAARADELGLITMTPFTYRFMPTNRYIKVLIDDGYIGRHYHLNLRYYTGYARDGDYRWRFDRSKAGSGVLGDIATHFLYLAYWWFGEIASIYCQSSNLVDRPLVDPAGAPYEVAEDTALITLEFKSGALGSLHISAVANEETPFGQVHACELHGSEGTLHSVIDWERRQEVWGARVGEGPVKLREIPESIWAGARRGTVHNTYRDVFREQDHMTRGFVSAVLAGEPIRPNFADGAYIQCLVEAALESNRTGRRFLIDSLIDKIEYARK